jgi:hypothetical protein
VSTEPSDASAAEGEGDGVMNSAGADRSLTSSPPHDPCNVHSVSRLTRGGSLPPSADLSIDRFFAWHAWVGGLVLLGTAALIFLAMALASWDWRWGP